MIKKIIKDIEFRLGDIDIELTDNIINSLNEKHQKIEISNNGETAAKMIELVDNIDLFLYSLEKADNVIMDNGKEKSLKDILKESLKNKTIDEKLEIFFEEFNNHSTFHILDSSLKFKTAGKGIPDTSIIQKVNGKYKIFYSAASHSGSATFEKIQLLRHPIKLQLSLDKAIHNLKGKETQPDYSILLNEEIGQIYKSKKLEYLDDDINLIEFIDKNKDKYKNKDIEAEKEKEDIDLTPDIDISTAYSSRSLPFIKDSQNNFRQLELLNEVLKNEDLTQEEIIDISQWMFSMAQMSTVYTTINEKEDELILKNLDAKDIKESVTKYISSFVKKIKYPKETKSGISRSNYSTELLEEDGFFKVLDIMTKYTKEYDFDKKGEKVTEIQSVLNNTNTRDNFLEIKKFMISLYKKDIEKIKLISNIKEVFNKQSETEIIEIQKQKIDKISAEMKFHKDKSHVEEMQKQLEGVRLLYANQDKQKLEDIIVILNTELKNSNITTIEILNYIATHKPEMFIDIYILFFKNTPLTIKGFLQTVEQVNVPEESKDILNLLEILNNLEEVINIEIEDEEILNLLNQLIENSINKDEIKLEDTIDTLSNYLLNLNKTQKSKVPKAIKQLRQNLAVDINISGEVLQIATKVMNNVSPGKKKPQSNGPKKPPQ